MIVRTPKGRAVLLFPYPTDKVSEPATESAGGTLQILTQPAGQEHPRLLEPKGEPPQPDPEPGVESPPPITVHTLELLQILDDTEMEEPE